MVYFMRFDGVDDKVTIPDNAAYSVATTGELTIAITIIPQVNTFPDEESTGYVHFLSKIEPTSQSEWTFRMYGLDNSDDPNRHNRISAYIFNLAGGLGSGADFEEKITPGVPIRVLATFDATSVRIYKNGVYRHRELYSTFSITPTDGTSPVIVGSGTQTTSDKSWFKGWMNNLVFWNRKLSNAEILDDAAGRYSSNGLVGYFPLNETSGTTANDLSSTNNDGTISGGALAVDLPISRRVYRNATATMQPGENNTNVTTRRMKRRDFLKSLALDGSTQYASIANASSQGMDFGSNNFFGGGWFRTNALTTLQVLMAKYSGAAFANNASGLGWELLYRGDSSPVTFNLRVNDGSSTGTTVAPNSGSSAWDSRPLVRDGLWHHYCFYVDQQNHAAYLWFDGVLCKDGSDISSQGDCGTSTGDFMIGRQSGTGTGTFLNGFADEVFLYNLGLNSTLDDVQEIVESIVFDGVYPTSGLVSRWSMNDSAEDVYGTNDLTLTGSPSYSTNVVMTARTTN